jgi:hypothetical protein
MLCLKSLQQRDERNNVQEGMEEAGVYERKGIRPVYYNVACQRRARQKGEHRRVSQQKESVHVATPVSFGINDPQARTSHTDWMLTTQKPIMRTIIRRVNRGRRNTYDRVRPRLSCGIIDAREAMAAVSRIGGGGRAPSQPDWGFRCLIRVVKINSAEPVDTLRQSIAALEGWFNDLRWSCPQKFCTFPSNTTPANSIITGQPRLITEQSQELDHEQAEE